jgi:ATP-dependent RNA helicase DeaD
MNQRESAQNERPEPGPQSATPARPTFDALALGTDVRKAVDELGYVHPTPVQLAVFEPAARGRSLVVQARTGTGKTAAFGMPIVDALVKKSQPNVQALILTPTRELALQVASELEQIAKHRGTKIVPIYGGAPMGRQIAALEEGAQIVCGTPGRVLDHLRRRTLDPSNIRIFVLDEADEMLSMGFAKELNAIIEALPRDRQGLYFSATIPPDVERLAQSHLKDPEWITLSSDQVGALEIAHYVYLVREGDKRAALQKIIEVEDPESAIVFCNTKDETERVAEMLKNRGFDADWLNGDLDQKEREKVMSATREGKLRFLVATDVAARGIDISHLTHVINADFPESAEQYVHRTGRTGRAGKTGTAISVVGPKDVGHLYMLRLTYKIRPIERSLPTKGEMRTREETDLVAFLADAYATKKPDPLHLAVARRLFTHEQAEAIVAGLLADHLGASGKGDAKQEAAEARRAKNPPPVATTLPVRRAREDAPTTLRDGEARRGDRARDRDRPRRGQPQAALSSWEPPADADDDAPLFAESGTKPGIGPGSSDDAAVTRPREARPAREGRRGRRDRDARAERGDEMPGYSLPRVTIEDAPTATEPGEHADRPAGDRTTVFLNIGRRDGLRPSDLQRMLSELAGIPESETSDIRIRDRITFVTVRRDLGERVIHALVGQTFAGRTISAEPARSGPDARPAGDRDRDRDR